MTFALYVLGKCSTGKEFVIFCDTQEKLQILGISRYVYYPHVVHM